MGILGGIAGQLLGALANPSSAGSSAVTLDELTPVISNIAVELQTVDDVFDTADDRMAAAVTAARNAGDQVATIGDDLRLIVQHTYDTVIPESLSWLRGDLILHYIDPLRAAVHHINRVLSELIAWQHGIDSWRRRLVDPELRQWERFRSYFYGWPYTVLGILHQWLQQPATFGQWATPAIAKPLVDYLGAPARQQLLDQLTAEIVDSSPDVFRHVEAAALAVLQSPWP